MPCPFFEPTSVALNPRAAHARLPLIEEYDGLCHAGASALPMPLEVRFAGCNHGRAQEHCPRFQGSEQAAIRRFTVQGHTSDLLAILVTEEIDHYPVRWRQVEYSVLRREVLEPCSGVCEKAQIQAFCSSYLQRFPGIENRTA